MKLVRFVCVDISICIDRSYRWCFRHSHSVTILLRMDAIDLGLVSSSFINSESAKSSDDRNHWSELKAMQTRWRPVRDGRLGSRESKQICTLAWS